MKKITWLENFDNEHTDSVWYGGDIVEIRLGLFGRYVARIGAYGDIRAHIKGEFYCDKNNGGCFKEYLEENGIYNDNDLKEAIEKEEIVFENNNWYEIFVYDTWKKDYVGYSYDSVIDELERNDNFSWVMPWIKQRA